MPANADTAPDSTNSRNLVRSTLTPVKCAASLFSPMSKMPRPNVEKCSSNVKTTATIANGIMTSGTLEVPMVPVARSVHVSGKPVTALVPSRPTAIPRNSASVPMVTARDGSPT